MFLSHTVEKLRPIAQRKRATAWLVQYEGSLAVLKQYSEDAAETYAREVRHVERLHRAGFTDMPNMLAHDDAQRCILYEYFPDGDVWTLLLSRRGAQRDELVSRTLDAMEREAAALQDTALRDLSFVGPDPYVCLRRLVQRAETGDDRLALLITLAREISDLPGPFLCARYDPELTNYLLAPDGRVCACDLAGLRCCHALYLPTYALIHIVLASQQTQDPEACAVLGRFTRAARERFVRDITTRRLWLLNLAEVFAYFVDWGFRRTSAVPWHLHGLLATTAGFLRL